MFPNDLKFFKKSESWGEPDRMSIPLLRELDSFRAILNTAIVVTCGTQGRHEENSRHYTGQAVDIVIPDLSRSAVDIIFLAFKHQFTGIGYYPTWLYNSKPTHGFHLELEARLGLRKTWLGIPDKNRKTGLTYIELSSENLNNYNRLLIKS